MTNRQFDKVATLERRLLFLQGRIANYRADGDPNRDKAEAAALKWALQVIGAADGEGVLNDLESIVV